MVVWESITSLQNPRIKNVVRLGNRRHRDQLRQTVVEGVREASRALLSGQKPIEAYFCAQYLTSLDGEALLVQLVQLAEEGNVRLFEVPPAVYDKMAYRSGSGGVLLIIPYLDTKLEDLPARNQPLYVVIDGVEKPGNLGAILRSADAAGVDGLFLTNADVRGTDIHNPNAIRASLGALFTVPVVTTTRENALRWFRDNEITSVATTPEASSDYSAVSYAGRVALVMGSESGGLSREWLDAVDIMVRIPMAGIVDSLNLSVATAVMLFEAVRQRNEADAVSALAGNAA